MFRVILRYLDLNKIFLNAKMIIKFDYPNLAKHFQFFKNGLHVWVLIYIHVLAQYKIFVSKEIVLNAKMTIKID